MSDAGTNGPPPIDEALVRRLLAAQFPQWAELPISLVPLPGVDNATFRLGGAMSVRLPRFPRWVGQVEREHEWLPRLAPHLPLPIPVPLAKGEPGEGYPYPWSVYRWIDGTPGTADGFTDDVRTARDLAEFVRALQRIDPAGGPAPQWSNAFRGVPLGDERDSIATEARVRPKIADLSGLIDTGAVTAAWEAALAAPPWAGDPVWVHGDLAPANMLTREGRLSAVIDFGTVAVGDPAVDLLPAWGLLDAPGREVFRSALGVDDATWARGRGWALASALPAPSDPYFHDHPERIALALRRLAAIVADTTER
ncbi:MULTISPECIES: aminoglycoside phosphotransferase family protein [unclassified Streptomyces]|uniref:aminoglycoside phosphotransferase family protein n=1 Tax=unclassified Streptomyces TaxID=2593676 RepID=UPI002E2BEC82|nr:aminoglycoside phosphotransferase family protein [Streptomyces sp. NBC_00223]